MAESFTVVFNVQRYTAESGVVPPGTTALVEAKTLPPITTVTEGGTQFEARVVTLEAGSAAEALKAARQFYKDDAGVGFAVKTSAVTYESI